jgi:hypothetical protein
MIVFKGVFLPIHKIFQRKCAGVSLVFASAAILLTSPAFANEAGPPMEILATSNEAPLPVAPFKYIPSERWQEPDLGASADRSAAAQKIADYYKDGNYADAGSEGYALITKEKIDEQLQLFIANSLAWTNRTKQAGQLYRVLADTKFKYQALLGLANIHRWQGRDHLAQPMYKEVLAAEPKNKDAIEGLRLADREVRPRTTVTLGGLNDSSDVRQRTFKLNHRWRDDSFANIWEVETGGLQNKDLVRDTKRQDFTVRFKSLEMPFKPRVEVGSDGYKVYGNLGVAITSLPVLIDYGRVNWGDLSNNPKALAAKLSASRLGLQVSTEGALGGLLARADMYKISDGNTITTSTVRLTPAWRPLGKYFKPLVGMETRAAKFNSLNYWSPSDGYGSAFAGVMAEFEGVDWNFFASAQGGVRLFGEAGNSWSASLGGKRWLNDDWSIGFRLWTMASRRDSQQYRARSGHLTIEKLWN